MEMCRLLRSDRVAGMRSTDTISRGGDAVSGLAALLLLISVCVAVVGPNLILSSDMRTRRTCTFCCVIYLEGQFKTSCIRRSPRQLPCTPCSHLHAVAASLCRNQFIHHRSAWLYRSTKTAATATAPRPNYHYRSPPPSPLMPTVTCTSLPSRVR